MQTLAEKKAYHQRYYAEHKEEYRQRGAANYRQNKRKKAIQDRTTEAERRKRVLRILGGECVRCGFKDWRALQIDHKDGGGWEERMMIGMHGIYKTIEAPEYDVRNGPYQLLCANCNWIKRYENGEHKGIVILEGSL